MRTRMQAILAAAFAVMLVLPAVGAVDTVYGIPRSETMIMGVPGDVQTINPLLAGHRLNTSIDHYHLHDVLVHRAPDGTFTPRMAESWKQVDDLTWEVKIRDGIYSHSGEKLTAENVKFTCETIMARPEYAVVQLPEQIGLDRVVVVDELTFQFKTKAYSSTVPYWMFEIPIVPIGFFKDASDDKLARESDGFGPYKLVRYVPNDYLLMERFDGYWGGRPDIPYIIYRVIPEESARVNELRAGSIDFAEQISIDMADQANTAISHVDAQPGLRKMALTMSIEHGHKALSDVRVRQALNYAIDKENITENILSGFTAAYDSYVNPANNNPKLKQYPYDPEKAKRLLAEAGYANGLKLTLVSPSSRYGLDKEITQQLAYDLGEVGVEVDCQYLELGVFLDRLNARELKDLIWIGWAALTNPIIENLILTTGHVDNCATWSNPEFDALYQKMATSKDPAEVQRVNFQMQEIAWEQCPWIWLWKLPQVNGLSNRIEWKMRNDGYLDPFNARIIR